MFSRWDASEIFVQVVDAGSFSAAAAAMDLSKSYVSRQLSALEAHLGVQLMQRSTRQLSMTEAGRQYYQSIQQIIEQMGAAEQSIAQATSQPRGLLRVSSPVAFGERYIAPVAARYLKQYGDQLKIDIKFTNRSVDLIEENFDLAIRTGVLRDSSMIARRVAPRRMMLCASPEYLQCKGQVTSIAALKAHNCLMGSNPYWHLRDAEGKNIEFRPSGNWRSDNGYALLAAAREGLGVVQLPAFYVHQDLAEGRLIELLPSSQPTDTAVWAVYPSRKHVLPKVQQFIQHLQEALQDIEYL